VGEPGAVPSPTTFPARDETRVQLGHGRGAGASVTDLLALLPTIECRCGHPEATHLPPWEGTAWCPSCAQDCLADPSPLDRVRSWAIRRRLRFSRRAGVGTKLLVLLLVLFVLFLLYLHVVAWLPGLVP
jgi:hypothetical protein